VGGNSSANATVNAITIPATNAMTFRWRQYRLILVRRSMVGDGTVVAAAEFI
jgi:hypothetical protein